MDERQLMSGAGDAAQGKGKRENLRNLGTLQERRAGDFLLQKGYHICEYNFRCRQGEIDIVATEGDTLVFVEVKYRADLRHGSPFEAVNTRKQRIICQCADFYRVRYGISPDRSCRFDVVGICGEEIVLIRNAFAYCR